MPPIKIFEAIIASVKNEPVDLVTLSGELEQRRYEEVGGMAYLVSLANAVPSGQCALLRADCSGKINPALLDQCGHKYCDALL